MSEHEEQVALFEWAALMEGRCPELRWMFAIPNGGKRPKKRNPVTGKWYSPIAEKLKAEGQKAGVLDVFLPVARKGYHGLFIEMKFDKNKLTPDQREWSVGLAAQGYMVVVAYGAEVAIHHLADYLGMEGNYYDISGF